MAMWRPRLMDPWLVGPWLVGPWLVGPWLVGPPVGVAAADGADGADGADAGAVAGLLCDNSDREDQSQPERGNSLLGLQRS